MSLSRRRSAEVIFLLTPPDLARAAQRALAESHLTVRGGRVSRLCPHCGGADHGRPRLPGRHLSLSYAEGLVTIAVAQVSVGVDAEADGPAPAPFADRLAWTRAEAVLKLTGEGVRRDPATVRDDEAWTLTLRTPSGYVATLAAATPLEVSLRTETAAVSASPATGAATT
jgi:hypothetical protein